MAQITISTPICLVCNKTGELTIEAESFEKWQSGTFIQDAFPELSADQREMLMTGIHGKCWDQMFPNE